VAAAVLGLALAVRLPLLAGGEIDFDEGVYWQSLRSLAEGHPLFAAVYSSQPPAFLLLLLPPHLALGGPIVADRAGVLALCLLGLAAAYRIGAALGGGWTGVVAAAVLAADPLYFRESVTLQADGPAMALGLAGVAMAIEAGRRQGRPALAAAAGAGAVLALAVLTKLLAVAAGPAVAVALVAPAAAGRRPAAIAGRLATAAVGGLVVTALVLLPFAASLPVVWQQSVGFHLAARTLDVGGLDAATAGQELPVLALGLAGALLGVRRAPLFVAIGAAWALPAVLLVAVQHPLWPHHLVVLTTPLALVAGGTAAALVGRPWRAAAAAVAAVAASLLAMAATNSQQTPDERLQPLVAALRASTAPGDQVVTDDPFAAARAGRSTPPELVDPTRIRMNSGNLTPAQAEAVAGRPRVRAVLFATDRLAHLPGFQAWVAQRFPVVRHVGPGQDLYLRSP
jgi:4-amino-4-deoxy-L-arabinose transferase-like glycosyltransferase